MADRPADSVVRFANFTLNLATGDLKRDGVPVRLRRQPAQILTLLVARAGELVTRQEVIDHVWPGTTVEYDQGLSSCIRQLRAVLGDVADHPSWIETIPRQGYRFLGAIESLPPEGPAPRSSRLRLGIATVIVVAGVLTLWAAGIRSRAAASGGRIKVAVLPLAVEDSTSRLGLLGDALLEDLIDHLARLEPTKLGVIARTSVMRYRGTTVPMHVLGAELDVGYLVEGSLSKTGETVRVGLRLVRTSDQTQIWATRWVGSPTDLLDRSDDLAAGVVTAILPVLQLPSIPFPQEPGPGVRDVFLEARYLLSRGTRASVEASVERFREVRRAQPGFAPAAAGLARGLYRLGHWADAESAAREALQSDPDNVSARLTLADVALLRDWDWRGAEAHYLRALRAAPGDAEAHNAYSFHLASAGRTSEAISHAELAQRLDPVSPVVNGDLGYIYFWSRRADEAVVQCRKAIVLAGPTPASEECLMAAFGALGLQDSSLVHARRLAGVRSGAGAGAGAESPGVRFRGLEDYWRWVLDQYRPADASSASGFVRAMALTALGDPEAGAASLAAGAISHRALRDSQEVSGLGLYVVLGVDPRFDGLRSLPAFEAVLDSVGVPPAARRRRP